MLKIIKRTNNSNENKNNFCLIQKRPISSLNKNRRNSFSIFPSSPKLLALFAILFIFLGDGIFEIVNANKIIEEENNNLEEQQKQSNNNNNNLFQAYLSRGMFSCATKHVSILQKLNKLIATAHQEYADCQAKMDKSTNSVEQSRKLAAQLEMIGDLFNED
ncbi:unnamed protein product [Meloidogyne enterolobii]|uniref:Uncharacterized protein n=2 Tax=Meloidogyne enterolobii TaxID=390850 RepID=A0A6V7XST9_MELEN|nr:unnamed protein product [Meloidogyne enterolobii]